VFDDEILADPEVQAAIKEEGTVHRSYSILNTDRAALGRVGGAIARLHGDSSFAGTVSLDLQVWRSVAVSVPSLDLCSTLYDVKLAICRMMCNAL
jgi:hypothetical protein